MSSAPLAASDVFSWTAAWAKSAPIKLWQATETESTNSVAKNDEDPTTRPGALPSLYITKRQTAGRGRGSHAWTTPDGASLLSSWSFAIPRVPQPIFSAIVGLTLFETARVVWPEEAFNVKAPNDLFIADRKTAGLLIETVDQGARKRTVVGLGLNVSGLPAGLPTATCLGEHLSSPVSEKDWRRFLDLWLRGLHHAITLGMSERLPKDVADRLCAALNLHPLLKEPILRVDELGQLHSASRVVHWHEL